MALFLARLKSLLWQFVTKGPLSVIYVAVISEGLRIIIPALGQKLYKLPIPGAPLLEQDEAGHRLDCAHIFALFLLVAVFHLWAELIRSWLRPGEPREQGWDAVNFHRLIFALAVTILGADAVLFFYAITQLGWSGSGVSLTAFIGTAAYVAVLVFVSFVSVMLRQRVIDLSKEIPA